MSEIQKYARDSWQLRGKMMGSVTRSDVRSIESAERTPRYVGNRNRSLIRNEVKCEFCASKKIHSKGLSNDRKQRRWKCRTCGKQFRTVAV